MSLPGKNIQNFSSFCKTNEKVKYAISCREDEQSEVLI
jgi:hypothetical protein